jgi:hypothetical protein
MRTPRDDKRAGAVTGGRTDARVATFSGQDDLAYGASTRHADRLAWPMAVAGIVGVSAVLWIGLIGLLRLITG